MRKCVATDHTGYRLIKYVDYFTAIRIFLHNIILSHFSAYCKRLHHTQYTYFSIFLVHQLRMLITLAFRASTYNILIYKLQIYYIITGFDRATSELLYAFRSISRRGFYNMRLIHNAQRQELGFGYPDFRLRDIFYILIRVKLIYKTIFIFVRPVI